MPRLVSFCLIALFAVSGFQSVLALDPDKAITQYQQDFWTEENGLPQASVQTIAQTRNGYLWIGTRDGLARFDGTKFTIYRGEEYPGLLSDDIRSLFEDSTGRLWIGTFNGGVSSFQNETFRAYSTRDGVASGVLEIFEDSAHNLWFGTWKGIVKLVGDRFESFPQDAVEGRTGWAIWEDSSRRIWAATDRSLHIFENGHFNKTNFTGARPRDIRTVLVDQRGTTWIATLNGLLRAEQSHAVRLRSRDGLPDSRIRSLAEDRDGNVWVGTWSGLARIQGTNITSFPAISGERLNGMIEALFIDRDGSLWIGVRGGGLGRLRDARFTNLTTREGLSSNHARSIFEAKDGSVWIATDGGGLSHLRNGLTEVLSRDQGLPSDFAVSIAEDKDGVIWAGLGRPAAIVSIKNGKISNILGDKEGLASEYSVRALFADREGLLWAGGDGGLARVTNGRIEKTSGIAGNPVRTIAQDRTGALWVAAGEGLCLLRDGKVERTFTIRDGLSHNAVYSIFEDASGVLWLGTQQGLTRFGNGKFQALTRSKGGFEGAIYFVTEDDFGRLWMSSSRGISSVKKTDVEASLNGSIRSVDMTTFGLADGLKTSQAQGGSQSPGCRMSDGKLWFATLNGVAIVSPSEKDPHSGPPPVLLEETWVDRKPYRANEHNVFEPSTDDFEFHYTALKFITPERAQFRYQLVGHDTDWVYAKNRRAAYYNNLRPGKFTFRVAASSDGLAWSDPVASSQFRLLPHFYQTPVFYTLCVAAIALLAWAFHRRRLKQAQEKFSLVLAERTRIARDLHDTLAQGFAGTAFQLEALRKDLANAPTQTKRHLDLALTMVRHSFTEAKRAVMNLRSPALQNAGLVDAVRGMATQIIDDTGVELDVRVRGKQRELGPDLENELLRICQEAIANVIKHANATRIEVTFDYQSQPPKISIADNGVGFHIESASKTNGHHFGIQGMKERVKQVGGSLSIQSSVGDGCRITIEIP